jgi:Carboxypeptidase regulatory-like domain
MKNAAGCRLDSGTMAWSRIRCFLEAGSLLLVLIAAGGVGTGRAATCPAVPELSLSRLQGTVFGPSGVPVPQIVIQALQDGAVMATTHTDDKGKFAFAAAPGKYVLHIQFLGSKSLDLNVRIAHHVEFFRSARIRMVLGLSGTRCSFATTSNKQFKNEMKRYKTRLGEVQSTAP